MKILFDLKEFIEEEKIKYIKNARVVAYENKGVFFEVEADEKLKNLTVDDKIALMIYIRNSISMDERLNRIFKDIPFVVKEVN